MKLEDIMQGHKPDTRGRMLHEHTLYEVLRAVEFLELESRIAMEEGESGTECLMDKEFVKMKKFWRWMVVVA